MKAFLLLLLFMPAILVGAQAPSATPHPLNEEQIMNLVEAGMDNTQLAKKVEELGIDFTPTDEYLQALTKAGAQEVVIKALRAANPKPLSKKQVLSLVAGGVPSQRAAALVKQHGINFVADDDYIQTLRVAGADDSMIAAVRAASPAHTTELQVVAGTVRVNSKDGLKYVWVPAGTFMMGCSPGDTDCYSDENPRHQVTITHGFWLGQTEVTAGSFKKFSAATGVAMPPAPNFNSAWADNDQPILNETWDEASQYCAWAGGRLPTEAEWEYAARGGSTEAYYGDLNATAWYQNNSGAVTHSVGQKQPNGFGLFDVLGNVSEWVNDWHENNYYLHSPAQDPPGPATGKDRVLRGGSYNDVPKNERLSLRFLNDPSGRLPSHGIRCACEENHLH